MSVSHERRVLFLALVGGLPAIVVMLSVMVWDGYRLSVVWAAAVLVVFVWIQVARGVQRQIVFPLRGIAGILAAIEDQDFSVRSRGANATDALGLVKREVNALASTLHRQRLAAIEATALLNAVIEEIDVSVLAFDDERRLEFANRAARQLLGEGSTSSTVNPGRLEQCLGIDDGTVISMVVSGRVRKLQVRRSSFRKAGRRYRLLVLTDVGRSLRDEEVRTLRSVIRVLSHEISNSLAPIKSVSHSLAEIAKSGSYDDEFWDDLVEGLSVITSRADALNRFLDGYAKVAKLPPPKPTSIHVGETLKRIATLETRLPIHCVGSPGVAVLADPVQFEQLLINVIRNAVDASLETGGAVEVEWTKNDSTVEIVVIDDGRGLANPHNLFVPYYTTKPTGSGVGLLLSREIVEAHGGSITLSNRRSRTGCVATVSLPAAKSQPTSVLQSQTSADHERI